MHARLLLYGTDEILLKTRQWVLERRFDVELAYSHEELSARLGSGGFNLLVLCHSLTADQCDDALALIERAHPETRILSLVTATSDSACSEKFDICMPLDGPANLLAKASQVLGGAELDSGG